MKPSSEPLSAPLSPAPAEQVKRPLISASVLATAAAVS
jgi:hypothetical protein